MTHKGIPNDEFDLLVEFKNVSGGMFICVLYSHRYEMPIINGVSVE